MASPIRLVNAHGSVDAMDLHVGENSKGMYQAVPTVETPGPSGSVTPAEVYVPPTFCDRWLRGDFTILPESNHALDAWDIVVISALFVTAVAVPVEVALVDAPSSRSVFMGHVIDLIFTVDILLTFNVATTAVEKGASSSVEVQERRPMLIARQYMAFPFSDNFRAGWFWPDVLTVLPWDQVAKLGIPGVHGSSMRLIRVFRLLRMLRLVRVIKLFKRWQIRFGLPYSVVKVMTCASVTLLLVHWLACVWGHLGLNPLETDSSTWLANHLTGRIGVENLTWWEVYQNALYLCVVVLTSVGFGDITPTSEREELSMILTLFFTGVTWAWVVANVVAVISNMDPFGAVFNEVMDDLNSLMNTHDVAHSLKLRVRRHVHESYKIQREVHHHAAIRWLSAGLQGELAMQSGVDQVCSKIWFLRNLSEDLVIELADEFKGDLFSPGEIIMDRTSCSVITRGSCIRMGVMLGRDAVFGADMILVSERLKCTACPRTLTFLEVMKLPLESLLVACAKFPKLDERIRRAQIKLAIWRNFVYIAGKMKRTVDKRNGTAVRRSTWDKKLFNSAGSKENLGDRPKMRSWVSVMKGELESENPKASSMEDAIDVNRAILIKLEEMQQSAETGRSEAQSRWEDMDKRFTAMESQLQQLESTQAQMQVPTSPGLSPKVLKSPSSGKSFMKAWG